MKSVRILKLTTAWAVIALSISPSWAQQVNSGGAFPFHRSIVFGDSLSDKGSLEYLAEGPIGFLGGIFVDLINSLTDGRASNGKVWNEYLVPDQSNGIRVSTTSALRILNIFDWSSPLWDAQGNFSATTDNGGKSVNYAVAGAKFIDAGGVEQRLIAPVGKQVDAFWSAAGHASNAIDKNDLVTIWAGANDTIFGDIPALEVAAAGSKVAATKALNDLYAAGGRKFLIPNLPNYGSTPRYGPIADDANKATVAFNEMTVAVIREFRAAHPDVIVYAPDMVPVLETMIKYGSLFGYTNVTEGCFDVSECRNLERGSEGQNKYMFWDGVHPTTRTHSYVASYFSQFWLNPDLAGFYLQAPNNVFSTVRHYFFPDDARTLAGYLTGDAALYKLNGGTLTMTGANTYTGGTFIKDGKLQLGNGGTTGSIIGNVETSNKTFLAFNRSNSYTFGGAISGTGSVEQNGTGRTILTGKSTYTGPTTVNKGLLAVNGSLASKVTVNKGGTVGGIGGIGGLNVNNGGYVSPGDPLGKSIGKLTVNGNATFGHYSGYAVQVAADGRSDKLAVNGMATLGGTVFVNPENSSALLTQNQVQALAGKSYVILSANGTGGKPGISGTFDHVTPFYRFYGANLSYGSDDVILSLARNNVSFASFATTANAKAAASTIQSLMLDAQAAEPAVTGETPAHKPVEEPLDDKAQTTAQAAAALYNTVANSTLADNLPAVLPELAGDLHASIRGVLVDDNRFLRDAATNRVRAAFDGVSAKASPVLAYGPDGASEAVLANPDAATTAIWAEAYGSWSHMDSNGNAVERNRSIGGFVTGLDGIVADTWRLGVLAGYANSSLDGAGSSADVDSYQIGLYGGTKWNDLGLRLGASFAHHEIDTDRSVDFAGITDSNNASYDANSFQIFGEAGYEFNTHFAVFEPFAGLAYTHLKTDGFSEEGGVTALSSLGESTEATTTTLGLRASRQFTLSETTTLTANGMIGWQHAFGDTTPEASLAFASGNAFNIKGLPIAEDSLALEAGFDVNIGKSTALGLSYHGQIADNVSDHSIKADISVRF